MDGSMCRTRAATECQNRKSGSPYPRQALPRATENQRQHRASTQTTASVQPIHRQTTTANRRHSHRPIFHRTLIHHHQDDVHHRHSNQAPERSSGPHRHPRNHLRPDLPRQADRSRGQHERAAQGHHSDGARRARQPSGAGVHPRQPRALLYCSGHVEECPYVP